MPSRWCCPTREVADTIGPIVERLPVARAAWSTRSSWSTPRSGDGTAEIARGARRRGAPGGGAAARVRPGARQGRRDVARAVASPRGELIVYLDADTRDFARALRDRAARPADLRARRRAFVKGAFRRPFTAGGRRAAPDDGGRVTELTARPLLSAFYPELAGVRPAAGRARWRRAATCFDQLPFATGYAVETAMLIDARDAGRDRRRWPRWTSRSATTATSRCRAGRRWPTRCCASILERLRAEGRCWTTTRPPLQTADGQLIQVELVERPPYATLRARASGAPLRLHRPRRHDARQGRLAAARRRGQLLAAARCARSRPATAPASRS